ncbi:MAG: PQQ-binding-like beta-propeller repeat protein, partial [Chloroflexota bacterium]
MRFISIIVIICLAMTITAQEASTNSTYRGDEARTGVYDATPIRETPIVLWEVESSRPSRTTPVVANGLAYFGNEAGTYTAVNLPDYLPCCGIDCGV